VSCYFLQFLDYTHFALRQARGDDTHNFVRVVIDERQCNLTSALEWISDYHDNLAAEFLSLINDLPSFGSEIIDAQVRTYANGLGNWVRANEAWSFEVRFCFHQRSSSAD
jgi:Delta6-protoilludene synthase